MDNSLMASNAFVAVMVALMVVILASGLWSAWKLRRHRDDEGAAATRLHHSRGEVPRQPGDRRVLDQGGHRRVIAFVPLPTW